MIIKEEFIQHYGKKGMKWGVRSEHKPLKPLSERPRYIQRGTAGQQIYINNLKKATKNGATLVDKWMALGLLADSPASRSIAKKRLSKMKNEKEKALAGEHKVRNLLRQAMGLDVRYLKF